MLFDAQHGGRRHGASGCGHKRDVVTLNNRGFILPRTTQLAVRYNSAARGLLPAPAYQGG